MEAGLTESRRSAGYYTRQPQRFTTRTAAAWGFWTVIAINAGVIIWLWLYGGGVSAVHGYGDLWTSIGRVTGLVSAYLALIQVLLLSRLTWIERITGFDRLTVWHRLNGKICLYLVLAHVAFITVGYASMDKIPVPQEASRLLSSYPGMVAATIGTAMMMLVVASSLVIFRRKLRYELWYLVHLTVYAGIALAWVHQIPTGNEFTANATAATYWNALYIATAAILVWFRLLIPAVHLFRYSMRVESVTVEGPTIVSLRIRGRRLARLHAQAGQFFLWRFLSRSGHWWESHPFSLSEAPKGDSFRITVKNVGDFSGSIGHITPGTRVIAEGPFGVFTDAARRHTRVAMIAGGIGITPLRAMLESMPASITLIYRAMHEQEIVLRAELEALARARGATLHFIVGDHRGPQGAFLLSAEHLRQLLPDVAERDIYVCGPPMMMAIVERNLLSLRVDPRYIHSERFAL